MRAAVSQPRHAWQHVWARHPLIRCLYMRLSPTNPLPTSRPAPNLSLPPADLTAQVTTELRTLYGASHRNIIRYHQAFFDNGAITIVMEYCDGGSLSDVLKAMARTRPGQGMPECYIAEVARQVRQGEGHQTHAGEGLKLGR